ncbi:hypothetical protein SLEP1_g37585 [Rubroshorea leprosula]|uniref:Uncharacterized protein n=1 Tax=Rubroshorea leprosula TaxID=152421 RepID=A0AAV5KVF3_9ROSI|nr:hypothetical protein SLEP1_g37585 [Rubroshorea leprosula]
MPNIAAVSTAENGGSQSQSGNLGGGHMEEHAMQRPKGQGTHNQQQTTSPGGILSSVKHPAEVDNPPIDQQTQNHQNQQQKTYPSPAAEAGHSQPTYGNSYNFQQGHQETSINSQQRQHFTENQPKGISVGQHSQVNIIVCAPVPPPQESTKEKSDCTCCVVL